MSEVKISSTGWLAISLRHGATGLFCLHDVYSWQYLQMESMSDRSRSQFSPDGQWFACNGQNTQLNVYRRADVERMGVWWELKRVIRMKDTISAIELTNEVVFLADMNGDIYQVDLTLNDKNRDLIIVPENCIMKSKSMLLEIAFIQMSEKKSFLITADQDAQIRLTHHPNTSDIQGHCLGHTEFVSHVKFIDDHHILSASGDGTLRLWRLPDCVPLMLFHSKAFALLSKDVFYTELSDSDSSHQIAAMSQKTPLPISSTIDYSIWKIDITTYDTDIFLAFSIYAHRSHSIYLTSLSNLKNFTDQQRKLTLDVSYGRIVDYCFVNHHSDLYILFSSNILLKIDIMLILVCDRTEYFAQPNDMIQEINKILTRKEFYVMDWNENYLPSNEMTSFSSKRKTESIENEQRKKQAGHHQTTFDEYS